MTGRALVLSLFPGIGLLDMAFEEEGFCIVRGPDLLWGGDVKRFHPPAGLFAGVIGGPPCQAFSQLRFIVRANGYREAENLIPEFERICDEARPSWFVMENVPAAPEPSIAGYVIRSEMVRDVWVGGQTKRLRRFSFGTPDGRRLPIETEALHNQDAEHAVMATGGRRPVPVAYGGSGKIKRSAKSALRNYGFNSTAGIQRMCELQGLPPDYLSEAPFTLEGRGRVIGNGVPLPMGRAVAKAVKNALANSQAAA
jgi:DNA (cytosine-5)-methyltransferase 1